VKLTFQERQFLLSILSDKIVQLQFSAIWAKKYVKPIDARRNKYREIEAQVDLATQLLEKI
jgi:hypothetical protein